MKGKLVRVGSSLAVTLPSEVVDELKLKKGDEVEITVHSQTGAVIIRPAIKYFDDGKVTKRFKEASKRALKKYDKAFRRLE